MSLFNTLIPTLSRQPANRQSDLSGTPSTTIKPRFEIRESDEAWGLTVLLPGVNKEGLELTVDQSQLRVLGHRAWKAPATWTSLYRETSGEDFELVIEHENSVDAEKVHAEITEGVLRVSLPKAATLKPRKVAIN